VDAVYITMFARTIHLMLLVRISCNVSSWPLVLSLLYTCYQTYMMMNGFSCVSRTCFI